MELQCICSSLLLHNCAIFNRESRPTVHLGYSLGVVFVSVSDCCVTNDSQTEWLKVVSLLIVYDGVRTWVGKYLCLLVITVSPEFAAEVLVQGTVLAKVWFFSHWTLTDIHDGKAIYSHVTWQSTTLGMAKRIFLLETGHLLANHWKAMMKTQLALPHREVPCPQVEEWTNPWRTVGKKINISPWRWTFKVRWSVHWVPVSHTCFLYSRSDGGMLLCSDL